MNAQQQEELDQGYSWLLMLVIAVVLVATAAVSVSYVVDKIHDASQPGVITTK